MSKAVEELSKILENQSKEKSMVSLEDILEDAQLLDPMPSESDEQFDRFRKIPIGTFWNSQRQKSKLAKRKDLQKAIKKSTNNRLLDSTLLESLKGRKKFLMSPLLEASDSIPVLDDDISSNIPPPLNLPWQ